MSKYNVKQTKAQVYDSSSGNGSSNHNYSVIKPMNNNNQVRDENSERMLEEYMSKLNLLEEKKGTLSPPSQKKNMNGTKR